jgi:WD40 repeat protein/class 3 adenylate cyclase
MLQIRLLGQFDVRLDGKRILIPSRAGQLLLAYLTLTAGTSHRREKLAGMLWPDFAEETARKNLRHELWRIRKAISAQGLPGADYLMAEEFTITFNHESEYWLDVAQMERPESELGSLITNLAHYQGELLPGFYEDWIVLERERVRAVFDTKMEQLLEQLVAAERWSTVQEQAERWLSLGQALEPAYRALMHAYSARGDIAKVSSVYQRCMDELDEQFGLEPSAETRALYEGLLKGAQVSGRPVAIQSSGTVTFLFTDIEESTHLLEKLGDLYVLVLEDYYKVLRAAIQKWNGTEVSTQGDAFFVTFPRALEAVQCVAQAQQEITSHTWPHNQALRVRMGMHTGEPLIASTGYIGMDVHRASRIGDAAHGGQVLLSQTTRDLIIHNLPDGLTIRDLGEHRLKDLKFPTPIYQLVIDGLPYEFPALRTKFTGSEAPTPGDPPFKGLQYYEETDTDLFFGRELLTAKLLSRLRETQFLSVIIGSSGSGKSSLVRAGLIPALKKGQTLADRIKPPEGSTEWQVYLITPTAHPLQALATELTRDSESITASTTLMDDLVQDPRSLTLFLARQHPKQHILLVLDQFEELFTLCHDDFEREAFIDNLLTTLNQDPSNITLILTLRADFYAHLAQYPELRDAVARQQEYIGPMTTEELRRAVEEPARGGHWTFEPGLVDLILRDVGDEPGSLPLLSHALLETWKRRAGHTLTLKGYADAGGVRGAIAHTAESVYQSLSPDEQTLARNVFLRLTELGQGTEDTRRRVSFDELISRTENEDQVRKVINRLAEARLITLGEDTAEVAHEALIREWPTLRDWLDEDRDGLQLHRHLTETAHEWELLERDTGALYRGSHLVRAREWSEAHEDEMNLLEREFLHASIESGKKEALEREAQRQRQLEAAKELAESEQIRAEENAQSASHLRIRNRVITTVGVVALVLALLASLFSVQSRQNATLAQTNLVAAQTAQSVAEVNSSNAETAQAVAEVNYAKAENLRLESEADAILAQNGDPEAVTLLRIRALRSNYSIQADAALTESLKNLYNLQLFRGHTREIYSVAFSPDGKYALTGSQDGTARLWDRQSGREIRQYAGHKGGISAVAFSPDGKSVATGGNDQTTRIWDAATGQQLQVFAESSGVTAVAFSPDGSFILTNGGNKVARLWDAGTGQFLRDFAGHTGFVSDVAFSPDSKYVLTGSSDTTARVWETATGRELHNFAGQIQYSVVTSVAYSPDAKYVLIGYGDGIARLWEAETGTEIHTFSGHTGSVNDVAFSPDGKFALTGSDDKTVRLWDAHNGQEVRRYVGHQAGVRAVAFSPDGQYVLSAGEDQAARLWATPTYLSPRILRGHAGGVTSVAFSPDGKYALTGSEDATARLWDVASGKEIRTFVGHIKTIKSVAFSHDGKYVLTGSNDTTARLWNTETGQTVYTLRREAINSVVNVAFSPHDQYMLTLGVSFRGEHVFWDVKNGQKVRVFPDGPSTTEIGSSLAFTPDGKYLLSGPLLFDLETGKEINFFLAYQGISLALSPDGKYVLTGSADGAHLWDFATGQEIRPLIKNTGKVYGVAFSPDGRYALAGLDNTIAYLWDVKTGQELREFGGHRGPVKAVAFSTDGKYILTGSDDGTARLWDTDYHDTIRYACSLLWRDFTKEERTLYGIAEDAPTCPIS